MKNTHFERRRALLAVASVGVLGLPRVSLAANYPDRPIRLITPYAPGGISDRVARAVTLELQRTHGWNFVVENRTGANTVPAAIGVTSAPPDGYTLGWFAGATFGAIPLLNNVPYKVEQFQPVFMGFKGPLVLAVSNDVPANNVTQYVDWVRKSGKPALIGATSRGGSGHLVSAALGLEAKINAEVVPYRGGPPIVLALMANQLPASIDILDTFQAQHEARKLKIIGITSDRRLAVLPDVQTFAEAGYPTLTSGFWQGLLGPTGMSADQVQLIATRFSEAFRSPGVRGQLSADLETPVMSPVEFTAFVQKDREFWSQIIRKANIKPNE